MKNLRRLTWPVVALLTAGIGAGVWLAFHPAQWQKLQEKLPAPLAKLLPISSQEDEAEEVSPEAAAAIAQGNQLVQQARMNLIRQSKSLTANVLQIIQTPERTYQATGRFAQMASGKSRMEFDVQVGQTSAHVQHISNGQVIWLVQEYRSEKPVPLPKSEKEPSEKEQTSRELVIERVDLQRIEQVGSNAGLTLENAAFAREMLGGLTGLLATLETEMNFRVIKKAILAGEGYLVLEGRRKIPLHKQTFSNEFIAGVASQTQPERVRLYLRERDLMPARYVCLKKKPGEQSWYSPLAMELTDIRENAVIDAALFNYLPPSDQVPNDITHEYLSRLRIALKSAAAAPPTAAVKK